MEKVRSEDTLIFNALTPGITKMNYFYEALEKFLKKKKSLDPSDRFNIILFEELGPNYLEDFTLNIEHVMLILKSVEPALVKANVAGGIFVAITFIIDVFKRISEKCFRLIVFTDSGSLKIPESYIPALEGLIDQVVDLPFFMDVIRIGIDDPREDLKLMRLCRRTGGDIYEINDVKELPEVLDKLANKKEITTKWLIEDSSEDIPESTRLFFENLAEDPIPILEQDTCSICFKKDDLDLMQCPRCDSIAHKKCWAQWAKFSNIGIQNVFRCFKCYNLLILNRDYVAAVQAGEEHLIEASKVKVLDLQTYLENLESKEGPKIIQAEDPLALSDLNYEDLTIEFEDDEIKKESIKSADDGDIFVPKSDDELKIVWCPNCSKITTNEYRVCPYCNFPLDDFI
ncbi:MAG: hypothetical protein ACP6IY_12305 [Promethearchaeia archaeon]